MVRPSQITGMDELSAEAQARARAMLREVGAIRSRHLSSREAGEPHSARPVLDTFH